MTWLLMEYEKDMHDSAIDQLKQSGILAEGIRREDQLQSLDKASVDLVLVGSGWKEATIKQLIEDGVSAPFVHVATELQKESHEYARTIGCLDVVSYPLPINYLKMWAKPSIHAKNIDRPNETLSPIEEILRKKNVLNSRKYTYTKGTSSSSETVDSPGSGGMRGKIFVTYSPRGGVGKSMVTSLLARNLTERNYSVAVVDLHPTGNILAMNHRGQTSVTVDEWTKLPAQMDERMVKQSLVPTNGFWILPSGHETDKVDSTTIRRILFNIANYFDVVLVDSMASQDSTLTALEVANHVVFVMTPEWISFRRFIDDYEKIKIQKGVQGVSVVVNLIENTVEHRRGLRLLKEQDILFEVHMSEDRALYKEVLNAKPLTGSDHIQSGVRDLVKTLGFDPVIDELKSKSRSKKWRFALR